MIEYGSIEFHRRLVNDQARMEAWRSAIEATVREGDVVLDVGSGTGVLAFFAARAGARRVFAVERSPMAALARRLAADNGLAGTVEVLRSDLEAVELPEPVDVIVSELVSKSFLGQRMEGLIGRAREKWLKPEGRIVPARVEGFLAPVEAADAWESLRFPPADLHGLDFTAAEFTAMSVPSSARLEDGALLAEPGLAYLYDAHATPADAGVDATLEWTAGRPGTLHGFYGTLRMELAPGVTLASQPPVLPSWDNLFLPVPRAVPLTAGDRIGLRLRGEHPAGTHPLWQWRTQVEPAGGSQPVRFRQSSFAAGALLNPPERP